MARTIIRLGKPRKLTKPLKSTLKSVRQRFKDLTIGPPPDDVIWKIALSEDQYIENWKARLIIVLDDFPAKQKKPATSKHSAGTAKKPTGKAGVPAKTKTKRSTR